MSLVLGVGFNIDEALGSLARPDEHDVEHGSDADSEQQEERVHALALERLYEANPSPVNIGSKLSTHPAPYDCMLASGLQPS